MTSDLIDLQRKIEIEIASRRRRMQSEIDAILDRHLDDIGALNDELRAIKVLIDRGASRHADSRDDDRGSGDAASEPGVFHRNDAKPQTPNAGRDGAVKPQEPAPKAGDFILDVLRKRGKPIHTADLSAACAAAGVTRSASEKAKYVLVRAGRIQSERRMWSLTPDERARHEHGDHDMP
jgi:hypothetical protein